MSLRETFILPDWSAPSNVRALVSTRSGGVSRSPFHSFNLGAHVGDDEFSVTANRKALQCEIGASTVHWLNQVHGSRILRLAAHRPEDLEADGVITRLRNSVCAVQTADCLPVLLCDRAGTQVAAVHVGWRGLASGILGNAVAEFTDPSRLLAWLGPAIGPSCFEVGGEVYDVFIDADSSNKQGFEVANDKNNEPKWMANLYRLARLELNRLGVGDVSGGDFCTYTQEDVFFSYRRDRICCRMASLIWLV